jgi:NAD(P)H-flavin reductase
LADWHSISTITNTDPNGFSALVSNAGEFTKRTISRAPTEIYVRGIPTCGVLRTTTLFKSIVLVATGSGIGPCLAVLSAKKIPCRVLWIVPTPEETFGRDIIDSVLDCDPKAIIHNTTTQGKPDMNLMTYQLWKESGAEAVYVVGTKDSTTTLVYAMETKGILAYGTIVNS